MPDEITALQPSPELPLTGEQPQPQNEPTPPTTASVKSGLGEKISGVADRLAAKFSIKRGRGRPRNDGAPKISDVVLTPTGNALPARENVALATAANVVDPVADAALLHKCIVGGAKGALGGLNDVLRIFGQKAGLAEDYMRQLTARAEPDADALANFSEALDAVLKKRNINTVNAPEWALALATGRIAAPYGLILLELRKEIARRNTQPKN